MLASKTHVSPEFLIALRNQMLSHNLLRRLAKTIPILDVFESCSSGKISAEDGSLIMILQKESNYWIIRFISNIWDKI